MERVVQAGKFKAQCLQMMDDVKSSGKELIITKHNIPIVKLCPIKKKDTALFGKMQGSVSIKGNILQPIGEEWDANH